MNGSDGIGTGADADVEVALAYLEALGGTDPSAVAALVADSFRNEHHAELGSGCVGRDEYARRLPGFFATFPNRSYTVHEVARGTLLDETGNAPGAAGTEVIVNYRFGADAGDVRLDIPGVMWISVRDGEVTRRLDCWDSLSYHRQTGTTPSTD